MANKYSHTVTISLVIREIQVKAIMTDHYTPTNMTKIKRTGKYQVLERM